MPPAGLECPGLRTARPDPGARGPQWLVTTRYSSYPATAAAWGLGPGGRMERYELHGQPVRRLDFERPGCPAVGAADPAQAASCPNR